MGRAIVNRDIRDKALRNHPALQENDGYRRLYEYVVFGKRTSDGKLIISREKCAVLVGEQTKLRGHRFVASDVLEEFIREFSFLKIQDYEYKKGLAREFIDIKLPEHIQHELSIPPNQLEDPVYFDDGSCVSKGKQKAIRDEARKEAIDLVDDEKCEEKKQLLTYLNSLKSNRFATMVKTYFDEAFEATSTNTDLKDPENECRKLRSIYSQPVPFYKASERGRTSRIFPMNDSVASLARPIRKIMCQGFHSFDLRSAQLAIVAKLWDVPSVQKYLAEGWKIWPYVIEECGLAVTDESKAGIKDMTYALIFGGGWKEGRWDDGYYESDTWVNQTYKEGGAIYEAAREHFDKPKLGLDHRAIVQRFKAIPMIADVYKARQQQMELVREVGGAKDAFDNWIEMPWKEGKGPQPQSVLATQAQSYELKLLGRVIERAIASNEFDIVVWLHDGFYVDFRSPEKQNRIIKQLQEDVAQVANELGIYTVLDVS